MSKESKETSLQISGMTCAACATRIEKGLNKLDGVEEANVNLALEKSIIKYNPEMITEQDFEKKIQDLGYDVVKEKKEFTITGMTCAACAKSVERVTKKLEGVIESNVNYATEKLNISYEPSKTRVSDIKKAIEKAGYKAIEEETTVDADKERKLRDVKDLMRRTLAPGGEVNTALMNVDVRILKVVQGPDVAEVTILEFNRKTGSEDKEILRLYPQKGIWKIYRLPGL